jgi:hypothetical protein
VLLANRDGILSGDKSSNDTSSISAQREAGPPCSPRVRGRVEQTFSVCRIASVNWLMDQAVAEITRIGESSMVPEETPLIAGIADYAVRRLTKVCQRLRG